MISKGAAASMNTWSEALNQIAIQIGIDESKIKIMERMLDCPLVICLTQRFFGKNSSFIKTIEQPRNINVKIVSPTDAKSILKDSPLDNAFINTLNDINIATRLIIALIVKDNFRFISTLHVVCCVFENM